MANSIAASSALPPSCMVTVCKEQVSSTLGEEVVILNLKTGVYHGVDGVGAFIWNLLSKPISVENICSAVMEQYDVTAEQCQRDVVALIGELAAHGLVEITDATAA